jgi:hypothetical protein
LPALIQRKIGEYKELKTEIKSFLRKLENNNQNQNQEYEYSVIPSEGAYVRRIKELAENCTETLDTLMPFRRILRSIEFYEKTIREAQKRGVKFRLISEQSEDSLTVKIRQLYSEAEFLPKKFSVGFSIYDKKRVVIVNLPKLGFAKSDALLSCNPSLVELAQNYFDTLWTETKT